MPVYYLSEGFMPRWNLFEVKTTILAAVKLLMCEIKLSVLLSDPNEYSLHLTIIIFLYLTNLALHTHTQLTHIFHLFMTMMIPPLILPFKGSLEHIPPKFEHIFVAVITFPPFFCADTFITSLLLIVSALR